MWAETTKDGKVKFREQYKDPLTGKYKKVSVTFDRNTNQTRRKAQIALERKIQVKLQHIQDGSIKEGVTMSQLKDEWFEEYKKTVSHSTSYHADKQGDRLVDLFGSDTLVSKVNSKLISVKMNDYMYGSHPHTNDYTQKMLWKLKQMFDFAIIHEYVKDNPVKKSLINWRNERKAPTAITDKYLTPKEYKTIINYTKKKNPDFADLFQWLYLTGMRCGEAVVLKPSDFYQDNGKIYVTVSATLNEVGIRTNEIKRSDAPKTSSSFRTISLPEEAEKIYKKRLSVMENEFVFTNRNAYNKNKMITVKSADEFLRKAQDELNIDKRITTHIFRHTHVSKLAELGIPMYIIQRRVGHTDSGITRQVYLHITKKADQEADSKIDKLK